MTNTIKVCLLTACVTTAINGSGLTQATPSEVPAPGHSLQGTQPPQVSPREATFNEATEAFKKADELSAGLLSPKYYTEALKSFKKAQETYDRGGKLADIQKNLSKCMQNLELATRTAEICQVDLRDVLTVRNEALASGLPVDRSNDFREADKKLTQAAAKIEKGDLKGTKKPGNQAAERYRKAVIEVLEKQAIPDAKKKLKNAKKAYTKEDYKQAEESLKSLDRLVKSQKNKSFSVADLTSQVNEGIEQALKRPSPGS